MAVLQVGHPRPRRSSVRGMPPTGELGGYYVAEGLAGKTWQNTVTHANKPASGKLVPAENIPVSHVAGAWVAAIGLVKSVVTKVLFYDAGAGPPGAHPKADVELLFFRWGGNAFSYFSPNIRGGVTTGPGAYVDMTIATTPQTCLSLNWCNAPPIGNATEWNNIQFGGAFHGDNWMQSFNDPASYFQYSINLQIAYMIYLRQGITWR